MLTVDRDGNVDKLQRLDELAIRVSVGEIPVSAAYWQLRAMVTSPAAFGSSRWQILSYGLSSFAAAPLFYSGTLFYFEHFADVNLCPVHTKLALQHTTSIAHRLTAQLLSMIDGQGTCGMA